MSFYIPLVAGVGCLLEGVINIDFVYIPSSRGESEQFGLNWLILPAVFICIFIR